MPTAQFLSKIARLRGVRPSTARCHLGLASSAPTGNGGCHMIPPRLTHSCHQRQQQHFSTGSHNMGSTAAAGSNDDFGDPIWPEDPKLSQSIETYSRYQPCPISIAHFLEFGRNASLESSFLFLRREVPVRIANIMKELRLMPLELRETRGCRVVTNQYAQSFKELIAFERLDGKNPDTLKEFTAALMNIRERHADTVIAMAEAVMEHKIKEIKVMQGHRPAKAEKNIQYFLDRLYTSRISVRMLINQHTMLFDEPSTGSSNKRKQESQSKPRKVDGQGLSMVGTIDPLCQVTPVVEQAYESARFMCEQYYLSAPELEYTAYDHSKRAVNLGPGELAREKRSDNVSFVYVPSHLYHILFELFKNAMRATIENAGEDAISYEPIKVLVVKGREDVTIKVSDRGGGIPRSLRDHIFEYLYTTAPNPILTNSAEITDVSSLISGGGVSGMSTAPLAGLGYGLPLSRLYARYFAGDLELYSNEGWGTDAVIYLRALAGEAKERLPIYHESGSKRIYEAQLSASDWTIDSDLNLDDKKKSDGHNKDYRDL